MPNENEIPIPVELAREIARLGEARLNAVLAASTLAVTRATMLCGIFGAASVAIGAALFAYLAGESSHSRALICSGSAAAILFFVASILAAVAEMPRDFWLAGGLPELLRKWAWTGDRWLAEAELLDGMGVRFADSLEKNSRLLELESKLAMTSLWIAGAAPLVGVLIYSLT